MPAGVAGVDIVRAMRLHVHRFAEGPDAPVVCLHGVQGNGVRFRRLAAAALAGRSVLAADLRGHGRSGWSPPWNIETHLEDLRETLDAEGVDSADMVGFSFGGRLALEFAATDPARVGRIALLDPAIQLPAEVAYAGANGARTPLTFADEDAAIDARMAGLAHAAREDVAVDLRGSLTPGPDETVAYPVAASAVVAAYGEMARAPNVPPTHAVLLVRASGGIVDDRQEALLRATVADLTVVNVPGTHSVMWDAFTQTAAAVGAHLAR